jgi:S1-C subfamily serine protease
MKHRVQSVLAIVATAVGGAMVGGCAPDPPSAIVGLSVNACDTGLESGSGALVAPGIVLTAAHVVAGADSITVQRPGSGAPMTGEVVGFDPINDLAYVSVDDHARQHVDLATRPPITGDVGTAYVVRDASVVALPIEIARPVNIRTEDIYIDTMTNRPGYELVADIEPGDSGGVVVIHGAVVGVIWARSNLAANRAYAIDTVEGSAAIDAQLRSGVIDTDVTGATIDLSRCY